MDISEAKTTEATDRSRPLWLVAIRTAKAQAWASLPPDELEAAKIAQKAWREGREERRTQQARARAEKAAAARARMQQIMSAYNAGMTAAEIGAEIGLSAGRVREFAAEHGVLITAGRGVNRAFMFHHLQESALRRLSEHYGSTPMRAVEELLKLLLEEDAHVARRLLRVERTAPAAA